MEGWEREREKEWEGEEEEWERNRGGERGIEEEGGVVGDETEGEREKKRTG